MATGIPSRVYKVINSIYKFLPYTRRYGTALYDWYLRGYMTYMRVMHCNPGPHVGISDRQLLYVDPDNIERANDPGFFFKLGSDCDVLGSNWDTDLPRFEDTFPYNAFEEHFIENEPWEETEMYDFLEDMFEAGRSWGGYTSFPEAHERLDDIDALHDNIRRNGYKTQREIQMNECDSPIGTPDWLMDRPPEDHEIAVDIGRNGEIIFEDGRHRLAIAKVLDLDTVPVQVVVRHSMWQQRREEVAENPEAYQDVSHPDLRNLI